MTGLEAELSAYGSALTTDEDSYRTPSAEQRAAGTRRLVRGILARKADFGITRLGSITRLDRAGIAVAQAVRPLALSNAVSQGKGLDLLQAGASALMEALETWAAETLSSARLARASARELGEDVRSLYAGCLVHGFDAGWDQLSLSWIEGWDLFSRRALPVPAALVDTVYTHPSPHPVGFPRTTTGLAAGPTAVAAAIHAGLEVLERAAVAAAARRARFFDDCQLDCASVDWPLSSLLLARLRRAGFLVGVWQARSAHGLAVYWCHVIEADAGRELAPLPGEGSACDFTHDAALSKALLEAYQARVTAIAGSREDITRDSYPERHNRERLAEWRRKLSSPGRTAGIPGEEAGPASNSAALDRLLRALDMAGAKAAIVVPLFAAADPPVHVLRLVAPPLRHGGDHR